MLHPQRFKLTTMVDHAVYLFFGALVGLFCLWVGCEPVYSYYFSLSGIALAVRAILCQEALVFRFVFSLSFVSFVLLLSSL